jgi:KDO2-lipid IV(A) lauroyltransferase
VKLRKPVKYRAEYCLLAVMTLVFRLLPMAPARRCALLLGRLIFLVDKKHRQRAMVNLQKAFPRKDFRSLSRLLRRVYSHLAGVYVEFLKIPGLKEKYFKRKIKFQGLEHLNRALAGGKGVVAVTGHLGNWELLGAVLARLGYPLDAVYHPMRNPLSDRLINSIRRKAGISLISMKNSLRGCVRSLRENHILGLIADQDAGRDGVFVRFFNRPASTAAGPAYFALSTGAPFLFFTLVRGKGGGYTLHVSPPLKVRSTGNREQDIRQNTRLWSDELESWVRKYPGQWFWVHRRWHTKPRGAKHGKK